MAFIAYPATPDFHKFRQSVFKSIGKQTEGEENVIKSLNRTYIGTIKLHGTNTSILFTNSSRKPQFQSRNRIITPQEDNAGAAKWLADSDLSILLDEIFRIRGIKDRKFEELLIIGEWAGTGIQTGVAISSLTRFFAIFNIRIDGHWVDIRDYKSVQLPNRRIFNIANFQMYEVDLDLTDREGAIRAFELMKAYTLEVSKTCPIGAEFLAQEGPYIAATRAPAGSKKPVRQQVSTGEGIVWTMVPTPESDQTLYNFKTKGEQFLTTIKAPSSKLSDKDVEAATKAEAFVDFALGERRLEQGIEYLIEMGKDPADIKWIDRFKKWVVEDTMKEEGWRLEEKWEPEGKQAEDGDDGKGSESKSGLTLTQQGVTAQMVKKICGERAIKWFRARRGREVEVESAADE